MKKFVMADYGLTESCFFVYVGFSSKEIINHPKTDERVSKYFKENNVNLNVKGLTICTSDFTMIWLEKEFNLFTLVHELTHVTYKHLSSVGAEDEEEYMAYQLQYLLKQLMGKLFKKPEIKVSV